MEGSGSGSVPLTIVPTCYASVAGATVVFFMNEACFIVLYKRRKCVNYLRIASNLLLFSAARIQTIHITMLKQMNELMLRQKSDNIYIKNSNG